jgi:hypothetical protein
MAHQCRLDLPRLDAEAPHLHLRIRTTQELQHPITAPARKVPGAVHPAPRRTERVRNKPLRRQTRAPHIATRKARPRYVKLSAHTSRDRLKTTIQNVGAIIGQGATNGDACRVRQGLQNRGRGVDAALGRPIGIDDRCFAKSFTQRMTKSG